LKDSEDIFPNWLNLVTINKVMGKRTHDVRIVAVMLAYQVTHILTFNPSDFLLTTSIVVVRPQELLN
ncbi:MAG: PIN domain nuclease, partial [Cuspidothrix sp.]